MARSEEVDEEVDPLLPSSARAENGGLRSRITSHGHVEKREEEKHEIDVNKEDPSMVSNGEMGTKESGCTWALYYIFPPALYIISYVALDIMIAHSGHNGAYSYDPVSLIMVTELIKLIISSTMWLVSIALTPKSERKWSPSSVGFYYIIPASMYIVWSVLNFKCLLTVSLATFSVLYQSVVFFTAIAWIIAFNETISAKQWLALSLLCSGCLCAQITPDLTFDINYTVVYVLLQSGLSAVASVVNERLLKEPVPIYEQNTYLYVFSFLASALWFFGRKPMLILDPASAFKGFDTYTMCIAFLAALIGLLVTLILKYTNVIVKVYAQAFHAPLEVVIAHYTLKTPLGYMTLVSSSVIMMSSIWYYYEREKLRVAAAQAASKEGTKRII